MLADDKSFVEFRQRRIYRACHLLWLALSACTSGSPTQGDTELLSPPPSNYSEIVAARIGHTYFEAIIPSEAQISMPFRGQSTLGASSQVCVQAPKEPPAKENSVISVTFRAGEIVEVDYQFAHFTCTRATYRPFPEIRSRYKPPAAGAKPPVVAHPNAQNRQICYSGC